MQNHYTNKICYAIILVLITYFSGEISSQTPDAWKIDRAFINPVFIENRGQFDRPDEQAHAGIRFGMESGALKIYFAPNRLFFHQIIQEPRHTGDKEAKEIREESERQVERYGKVAHPERFEKMIKDLSSFVDIEWIGANPSARFEPLIPRADHYSYAVGQNGVYRPVIARSYEKLICRDLYPNIDVEYSFGEQAGRSGLKYTIIVRPGGDPHLIRMKYNGTRSLSKDAAGNIIGELSAGSISDQAPDICYSGNTSNPVKASFSVNDGIVSFELAWYDPSSILVIDPFISLWSNSPNFQTTNSGYTIRIDFNRNVYVMGGGIPTGNPPFGGRNYEVKKFNPAGALQWTAITQAPSFGAYGDMLVLPSGKAIVGHAFGNGGTLFLLNPANGAITVRNTTPGNEPGWRFAYNLTANNNVVWMGGGSNNGAHLYRTDTNVTTVALFNPWVNAGNTEDICYLAMDPAGAFLYTTNATNSSPNSSTTAPKMVKVATGTPGTAVWTVNERTLMMEIGQGSFMNGGASGIGRGWATGVNGMVVCGNSVYTYDGRILREISTATGAVTDSIVTGGQFDKHSGIDADNCCRIYIGDSKRVIRYKTNPLTLDALIPVTDEVYDLRLDPQQKDMLYVTGKGFVQKIDSLGPCSLLPTVSTQGANLCAGSCATLTASTISGTPPYTYNWSPSAQTGASVTVCPTVTTSYTVTVTDALGNTDSDTAIVTINPSAAASVTAPVTICQGNAFTLTASGGGTYSWNTGATTSSINVTPTASTNYSVIVTAPGGCKDTAFTSVTVTPNISPTVNPSIICLGDSAVITASGGTNYSWNTGGTTASIVVYPTATTSYTVLITAGSCSATAVATVTVTSSITATISGSTNLCLGQSATLTAAGGSSYSWSTGATSTSIVISPTTGTTYSLIAASGSCADTTSINVVVNPPPIATASPNLTICAGFPATLTAAGGTLYSWSSGATGSALTVNPVSNTGYTVTVTDANGCSDTASVSVAVIASPTVTIAGNSMICIGQSATLSASGAPSYSWSNGSTASSIVVTPATSTTYTVIGTNANGCTHSSVLNLTVNLIPAAMTTGNQTICAGDATSLAASGGTTYSWSTGSTGSIIAISPAQSTTYSVIVSSGGCSDTASATIFVQPQPTAGTGPGATINIGETATLSASGGGTYSWTPSAGLSCTNCQNPIASPATTTQYCVYVRDSVNCIDSACVTVIVDIRCFPVYLPNAFSPNGDEENDVLYVIGNCLETMKLRIYNRWGELVYEGTDPKQGWDGNFRQKQEDTGVFVYTLEYTLIDGKSGTKKGNISLLR